MPSHLAQSTTGTTPALVLGGFLQRRDGRRDPVDRVQPGTWPPSPAATGPGGPVAARQTSAALGA